jgi:hypothetical protein
MEFSREFFLGGVLKQEVLEEDNMDTYSKPKTAPHGCFAGMTNVFDYVRAQIPHLYIHTTIHITYSTSEPDKPPDRVIRKQHNPECQLNFN